MFGFGKKVEVEIPDGKGGFKRVKVPKKQLDQWIASGVASEVTGQVCRAHISDVMRGIYSENWIVGKAIDQESYDRLKDKNGDIYVSIHYEKGKPVMNVMKRELWDRMNELMDLG